MKKKTVILVSSLIVALVLVVLIVVQINSGVRDFPEIVKSGRLKVMTESSSLGFSASKDSVYGFQYEIIKAFADIHGLELEIGQQNNYKAAIEELVAGDYDVFANLIPANSVEKSKLLYSEPLINSRIVLVQKADSFGNAPIKEQLMLARDTIYVTANSPYVKRLKNLADEIADTIVIVEMKEMTMEKMVEMVAENKLKNTVCVEQIAINLKLKYPEINISLPLGFTQELTWATHTESPLLMQKLNEFLSEFIGSSDYWDLYRKYYEQ